VTISVEAVTRAVTSSVFPGFPPAVQAASVRHVAGASVLRRTWGLDFDVAGRPQRAADCRPLAQCRLRQARQLQTGLLCPFPAPWWAFRSRRIRPIFCRRPLSRRSQRSTARLQLSARQQPAPHKPRKAHRRAAKDRAAVHKCLGSSLRDVSARRDRCHHHCKRAARMLISLRGRWILVAVQFLFLR